METNPNTASQNPLITIQKQLDTLKSEYNDLEQQHKKLVYEYEYKLDFLKSKLAYQLKQKDKMIDDLHGRDMELGYQNYRLDSKVQKLEKQLSGIVPICSSIQPDIIQQYPDRTIKNLCPICEAYNVSCLIESHDLTAETQLARIKSLSNKRKFERMVADDNNMLAWYNENDN